MYGATRALLIIGPIAVADVVVLNALDATRAVALSITTVVVAATVLLGLILEDRHGGFDRR